MLSSQYSFNLLTPFNYNEINEISYSFWKQYGIYPQQQVLPILLQNLSFCIKKDNIIISLCIIQQISEKEAYVFLMATRKEYQKQGLGKYLLEMTLLYSLRRGITRFFLHTETTNVPAIKLYTKLGFEVIGIEMGYYAKCNSYFNMNGYYGWGNFIDPLENPENALVMELKYE